MTWLSLNWESIPPLLFQHLFLSLPAIFISVLVAVPLGRLAFRYPRVAGPVLSGAALMYTIPALPLLIIIPALFGVPLRSSWNMMIALVIYGVALLVRTAADAFKSVDEIVRQGAIAVGHSPRSIFWRVDLPLAVPVLLSGIRVVTVSTISLVTVGALIGVSSLGSLITDGFQRGIIAEVATGVLLTMALALLLDVFLLFIGRILTPWRRAEDGKKDQKKQEALAEAERNSLLPEAPEGAGANQGATA